MDNINNQLGFDHPYNSRRREILSFIFEIFKIGLISLAIILPVRYFLIQPFYVKGASMEPNFYDHEYLIIDEISYRFNDPGRGDIVVFRYPKDPRQYFIKRIIGLPGETVTIEAGSVFIEKDGRQELEEAYLPDDIETNRPIQGYSRVTLSENEYFLLGDNRDQSLDSRTFGPISHDFIIGRAWVRGWPLDRITIFSSPQYDL